MSHNYLVKARNEALKIPSYRDRKPLKSVVQQPTRIPDTNNLVKISFKYRATIETRYVGRRGLCRRQIGSTWQRLMSRVTVARSYDRAAFPSLSADCSHRVTCICIADFSSFPLIFSREVCHALRDARTHRQTFATGSPRP